MNKKAIDYQNATNVAVLDRRKFIKTGLGVTAALVVPGVAAGAATTGQAGNTKKKVLVINAHQKYPGISEGRLNRTLVAHIKAEMEKKGFEVKETYIEQGYNIDAEVSKHLWADVIITQSPVFWFGTPWIYKKYVDEVFTAGLTKKSFLVGDGRTPNDPNRQYGSGGKMQGKKYMLSLTMNAPAEAYDDKKQALHEGKSLDDLFSGNTANYKFSGVEILPIFACFNVIQAPNVAADIERLKRHLVNAFG